MCIQALQEELAMVGVTVAAFAFPAAEDVQSYVTQVAAIVSSGIKVNSELHLIGRCRNMWEGDRTQ
jgi:hypothetical protein